MRHKILCGLLCIGLIIPNMEVTALANYQKETVINREGELAELNNQYATIMATTEMDTVYISSTGSDTAAGNNNSPVATLNKALSKVKEGGTIVIKDKLSMLRPKEDVAVTIEKPVTIQGGELNIDYAGIILGADVEFRNIKISMNNTVRNAIIANGYKLTLNSVQNSGDNSIKVFAGAITQGQYDFPEAGNKGEVIVKGTENQISDIYAGNFSDLGAYQDGLNPTQESHFPGDINIVIEDGTTGTVGNIYAYGGRENREGTSAATGEVWQGVEDQFTIQGSLKIQTYGSVANNILGASDKKAHVVFNSQYETGYMTFSNINTLEVNGNLRPANMDNDVNIILNSTGEFNITEIVAASEFPINNLTGVTSSNPGILVLGDTDTLVINGNMTGKINLQTTKYRPVDKSTSGMIVSGQEYIRCTGTSEGAEVLFTPYAATQSQAVLNYSNGSWTASLGDEETGTVKPISFSIPEEAKIQTVTKSDINASGITIPVNFDFGEEFAFGYDVPLEISVSLGSQKYNATLADSDSGDYDYCANAVRMRFYMTEDSSGDILWFGKCDVHSDHADIITGTYTISITIETKTEKVTENVKLTVTDGSIPTEPVTNPEISISVKDEIIYDGSAIEIGEGKDISHTLTDCTNPVITWYRQDNLQQALMAAPKDAGNYSVKITADTQSTDDITKIVNFTIGKARLTAGIAEESLIYGEEFDAAIERNLTFTGFCGNDTDTVITGRPLFSSNYVRYQEVGEYTITADISQLSSTNYNILPVDGTLKVEAKQITVAWSNTIDRTYGDGKKIQADLSGVVNNDDVRAVLTGHEETAVGSHTAEVTDITGTKAKNYILTGDLTKDYEIKKATAPGNIVIERNIKWSLIENQSFTLSDFNISDKLINPRITAVEKDIETSDIQNIFSDESAFTETTVDIPMRKPAEYMAGIKGIYTVTIQSDSHEDISAKIVINILDKNIVDENIELNVADITYGDVLNVHGEFQGIKGGNITEEYAYSKDGSEYQALDNFKNQAGVLPVGNYHVMYTYSDDTQMGSKIATFMVAKKPITISLKEEYTKEYGAVDPLLEYEAEDLIAGDILEGKVTREAGEEAGIYKYDISLLQNNNYIISPKEDIGVYTITKAEADISMTSDKSVAKPGETIRLTVRATSTKPLQVEGTVQPRAVEGEGISYIAKQEGIFEGEYTISDNVVTGDILTFIAKIKDTNYRNDKEAKVIITVSGDEVADPDKPTDSEEPTDPDKPADSDKPTEPEDTPSDNDVSEGIRIYNIENNLIYDGSKKTHNLKIYDGNTLLIEKKDYTVSYKNNTKAYEFNNDIKESIVVNSLPSDEKMILMSEDVELDTGKAEQLSQADRKKAPQVTIRMKGNYKGTKTIYFEIQKVDIGARGMEAEDLAVTYNKKNQTPTPILYHNGKKLKINRDYTVLEYNDEEIKNNFSGDGNKRTDYQLTLQGCGNYTGTRKILLTIGKTGGDDGVQEIPVSKLAVKGIMGQKWSEAESGKGIVQDKIELMYKKAPLDSKEYEIIYSNNKAVGTATLLIRGTGIDSNNDKVAFIGSRKFTYKITGTNISKVKIEGLNKSYIYTGSEICPLASKTDNGTPVIITSPDSDAVLRENTHFTVTYKNNVNKGTGSIILDGKEEAGYTGTKTIMFKISPKEIVTDSAETKEKFQISITDPAAVSGNNGNIEMPFTKGGAKPAVTVKDSKGNELIQGQDYNVKYKNNRKITESGIGNNSPQIVITGKGNYYGNTSVAFTIVPKDLTIEPNKDDVNIQVKDMVEKNGKNGWKSNIRLIDQDGKPLDNRDADIKNAIYTIERLPDNRKEIANIEELERIYEEQTNLLTVPGIVIPKGVTIKVSVSMKTADKTGSGNYIGTVEGRYRIIGKEYDISKAKIIIHPQSYTGKAIEISQNSALNEIKTYLKVSGGERISLFFEDKGEHKANIEVVPGSYVKNIRKGTARVTIRGKEGTEYGGSKIVTFKIVPREIESDFKGVFQGK